MLSAPRRPCVRSNGPCIALLALGLAAGLGVSCRALPRATVTDPGEVAAAVSSDSEEASWDFTASTYLWVASKTGVIQTGGLALPLDDPDESSGAFLYLEGQRGPWGFIVDLDFLSSDDLVPGPNGPIEVEEDTFIGELDATWRPAESDTLQLVMGLRMLDSSQDLRFPVLPDQSDDTTLVDPVLGAQGTWPLTESVAFRLRADIGGFGVDSDLTYQTFGVFGWEFARAWSVTAGYRILGWEFEDDGVRSDLRLSGLLFGVAARF